MKATSDFSQIAPDEQVDEAVNFADYLQAGDTIASVVAARMTVAEKSLAPDPSPASRLVGPYSFDPATSLVVQTVGGCLANVTYVLEVEILTTLGEQLSIWAYLPCVAVGQP